MILRLFRNQRVLLGVIVVVCVAVMPLRAAWGQADEKRPLRVLIDTVQRATGYHVLYRDALVAGQQVRLPDTGDPLAGLVQVLRERGLVAHVDSARRQVLIARGRSSEPARQVVGQVVDGETGARLPHATVTWTEDGTRRGVTTNEAGTFRIALRDALARRDSVILTASYVGFRPERVRVGLSAPPGEVTFRLTPRPALAPPVVVSGSVGRSDVDTTWQALLQPGLTTPFGEASVIRALQPLPAVSLTGALTNGLNVRGSRSDGFRVLLDGMPIYNASHLFGTFDAFNEDVLQRVGLYYGVAPADLSAPPGGTLAFQTRTGSQARVRATAGISNTAARSTVEVPLGDGQGSLLVAGRHSYVNAISWLGSDDLIAQGLDVDPETSPLPGTLVPVEERLVRADAPSARFYDVHAKALWETGAGRRVTFSTYLGGDRTRQTARRLVRADDPRQRPRFEPIPVETSNRWGNEAAGLHLHQPWGDRVYSRTLLAVSRYHSDFAKDDFLYSRTERPADGLRSFVAPFTHENELVEGILAQHVDVAPAHPGLWTLGAELHGYDVDYAETSALRPRFVETRRSLRVDLFAQYDWTQAPWIDAHLGFRTHYYTLGAYARLSPRLKVELFPDRSVTLHGGYSRNHQFVHRLSLPTTSSADVWVASNERNAPGRADHATLGIVAPLTPTTTLQAEAYVKHSANVWQHETGTTLRRTDESVLFAPWAADSDMRARGLELMHQQRWEPVRWTNSYTLSRVELHNDRLNEGKWFPADWDRRHQGATQLQGKFGPWIAALTGFIATGTANPWAAVLASEPEHLDVYHRLDAVLQYRQPFSGVELTASASVYNLYDRENAWYRDPLAVLRRAGVRQSIGFRIVDVYDLGRHLAFNVSLRF